MNTAKVVLLFVLTKYFNTFICIVFFFLASFQNHRRHTTAKTTAAPRLLQGERWARPRPIWRVRPHIHSRPPRRAHATLLSAAGTLASELMVSGLFSKGDCSIYQLFRFSVWVTSYKGVVYVIRLLSIIYRGETIIIIQKNRKYLFNSIQNNQKPTIFARKQINI